MGLPENRVAPRIHLLAFSFPSKVATWWYTTFSISMNLYLYIYIHLYIYISTTTGMLLLAIHSALLHVAQLLPWQSQASHLAPHEVSVKPQPWHGPSGGLKSIEDVCQNWDISLVSPWKYHSCIDIVDHMYICIYTCTYIYLYKYHR